MELRARVENARAVATLATITGRDRFGRVRSLTAPGRGCYRLVLISRVSNVPFPKLAVECNRMTDLGLVPCEGHGRRGGFCYHSIGSVERALSEAGVRVQSWFKEESAMMRVMNLKQYRDSEIGYCFAKRNSALKPGLYFIWRML